MLLVSTELASGIQTRRKTETDLDTKDLRLICAVQDEPTGLIPASSEALGLFWYILMSTPQSSIEDLLASADFKSDYRSQEAELINYPGLKGLPVIVLKDPLEQWVVGYVGTNSNLVHRLNEIIKAARNVLNR